MVMVYVALGIYTYAYVVVVMSILDKLVEKKDILAYVNARTQDLLIQITKISHLPEHKREMTKLKLEGRVAELDHLRKVVASGTLKNQSKHHWRIVHLHEKEP